mmetsp:Transcript_106220/g.282630  ORF Transcript_106220/g.282630 Transcript_106220/m.282630 type:complete len:210 (+) Transcript_106220:174-803(+)
MTSLMLRTVPTKMSSPRSGHAQASAQRPQSFIFLIMFLFRSRSAAAWIKAVSRKVRRWKPHTSIGKSRVAPFCDIFGTEVLTTSATACSKTVSRTPKLARPHTKLARSRDWSWRKCSGVRPLRSAPVNSKACSSGNSISPAAQMTADNWAGSMLLALSTSASSNGPATLVTSQACCCSFDTEMKEVVRFCTFISGAAEGTAPHTSCKRL